MFFELFVATRYLKAKRKQAFISIITIITVLGVMVGVMALIIVLSVLNGFFEDIESRLLGLSPHIVIQNYQGEFRNDESILKEIDRLDDVVATTPFIISQVLVKGQLGVSWVATLFGFDTQRVSDVIDIQPMIQEGSLASIDVLHNGLPGIIIGTKLSKIIGVEYGDELTVISPQRRLTSLGYVPISRTFRVSALFHSGDDQHDSSKVFVSLKEAQRLLDIENRVSGIQVKIKDIYQSDHVSNLIREILSDLFYVRDWQMMNKSILAVNRLTKITFFIILTMIILVGALNIISTLIMVIMEKTKDIAILRSMGITSKSIMKVFVFYPIRHLEKKNVTDRS